jgi:hypothetical protein
VFLVSDPGHSGLTSGLVLRIPIGTSNTVSNDPTTRTTRTTTTKWILRARG